MPWTSEEFRGLNGIALSKDTVVIVFQDREADPSDTDEAPSLLLTWTGEPGSGEVLEWTVITLGHIFASQLNVVAVGKLGQYYITNGVSTIRGEMDVTENGPYSRGYIMGGATIANEFYAVGMSRQVYRWTCATDALKGQWISVAGNALQALDA